MNKWKSTIGWLHLWLGLFSGTVLFIVSITGALYVFHDEIKNTLEPWRFVEPRNQSFAPPTQLLDTARQYMPGKTPSGLTYEDETGAAAVGFYYKKNNKTDFGVVFLNPYTAEFLHKKDAVLQGGFDFFRFLMKGHRNLWLPEQIGRKVVGTGVLIFLFLLLSGLIMWWPKNLKKQQRRKSFHIGWRAGFKRLNYDLHNVLGFYVLLFGLVLAISGLVWSFSWFENGLYFLTSGGEKKPGHRHPHSDVSKAVLLTENDTSPLDRAYYLALAEQANPKRIYITPHLKDKDDAIEIVLYEKKGKFYRHNEYFFDQYTLEPLRMKGDRYSETDFAEKLSMMNYDIHTGAILGLPGKILAFLVSLICASLPITGFIIWIKKKQVNKTQRDNLRSQLQL
ncbi:MAG: PepSY-associated TM helix domain-containing protein [Draconibacterium sp.]